MEGIKIVIFALVAVIWLAVWIIKMFRNAFNQPAATNKKPYVPKPNTSLEEMLRQHLPKPEAEIRERAEDGRVQPMKVEKLEKRSLESEKPKYKSLEVLEPRRRSLEKLEPHRRYQEKVLGETTLQCEDIVRRRREQPVYQKREMQPISVFAQMLRNPESARNAVVLAEILKRKF